MSEIVFALYRPKPGREAELAAIVAEHVPALRKLGLATRRTPIVARSRKDGTIVEAFEWASSDAIARAHAHPAVQAIWARFAACADYPALGQLAEAGEAFAGFEPVSFAAAPARRAPASAKPKRAPAAARKPARGAAKRGEASRKRAAKKRGRRR
jgi:hypothetical protein